jgi:septal ring factor EnvC (AmiA/AmiB activator)
LAFCAYTLLNLGLLGVLLVSVTYNFPALFSLHFQIVPGIVFTFFLLLSLYWHWKGQKLYESFLQEAINRLDTKKNVVIPSQEARLLRSFHLFHHNAWLKIPVLLIVGSIAFWQVKHEIHLLNLKKPESLSHQLARSIAQKTTLIQQNRLAIQRTSPLVQQHQAELRALEATLRFTKYSLQEQSGTLGMAQGFRYNLSAVQQKINSSEAAAQEIRAQTGVYQQVKGLVEVYLSLASKEVSDADNILSQDTNVLKSFQDLIRVYDTQLHKAQKSVVRDQDKSKELQKQITARKQMIQHLLLSIQKAEKLIRSLEAEIQETQLALKKQQLKKLNQ